MATLGVLVGSAVIFRRWHLTWGATESESRGPMPGDDIHVGKGFRATRAITVSATPGAVWPWIVQMGVGRAGFYAYDWIDNRGRPSATVALDEFQDPQPGDLAAPMTSRPTSATSFRVARAEAPHQLVWAKPGSVWAWDLRALPEGTTRLVVRLRSAYAWTSPKVLLDLALLEVGDFPMMRKCLLGIRKRAEATPPSAA